MAGRRRSCRLCPLRADPSRPSPKTCWRAPATRWRRAAFSSSRTSISAAISQTRPALPSIAIRELYVAAAQKRGADPFIGRKLVRLLEACRLCRCRLIARAALWPHRRGQAGRVADLRGDRRRRGRRRARHGRRGAAKAELKAFATPGYDAVFAAHLPGVGAEGHDLTRPARQSAASPQQPDRVPSWPDRCSARQSRNKGGSRSGRSSAIRPGPNSVPASACSQTAAQAASNAGMPCASSPATIPGQHIAGAGRRQPGRTVRIDRGPTIMRRDHRVGPFQDERGVRLFCRTACPVELGQIFVGGDLGKQSRELTLMRRQDQSGAPGCRAALKNASGFRENTVSASASKTMWRSQPGGSRQSGRAERSAILRRMPSPVRKPTRPAYAPQRNPRFHRAIHLTQDR